jgi:antirestriction protein ArdC
MPKPDLYQQVTDRIIQMIEDGASSDQFELPWTRGFSSFLPLNARSKATYNGINILMLWCAAKEHAYEHDVWATYRQWAELGAQVRGGEKGTPVVYVGTYTKENEDGEDEERKGKFLKRYAVFNVAQVDGFDIEAPKRPALAERIENAERFVANTKAKIEYGANSAYYHPGNDTIHMPDFERFTDTKTATATENAYSTLLHELTHWTAPEDRADRPHNYADKKERAFEELVAELGASFLCASLGITPETRADHAHYLASWLKALKDDKKAIFRAATQASKAAEYLHSLQPETQERDAA